MSSKKHYDDHPLASVLPMMGQFEINELAADIQANGLRSDLVLLDGKILDGRNRYRACQIVGVEPRFRDFNGDGDPLDFIVSANVKRRHLNTSQRGMVATKIANLPRGQARKGQNSSFSSAKEKPAIQPISQAQAAKLLNVGERTVRTARQVLVSAPSEEIEKIERGDKTVEAVLRETKQKAARSEQHTDKTGCIIPPEIYPDWQRAEAYRETLHTISKIKCALDDALEHQDVVFAEINNTTIATLKNAYGDLGRVIPFAVCTSCQGLRRKKCTLCRGRGWVSEFLYKTAVPLLTRKIREGRK